MDLISEFSGLNLYFSGLNLYFSGPDLYFSGPIFPGPILGIFLPKKGILLTNDSTVLQSSLLCLS